MEVCPYDVFEVRQIDDEDFSRLSFLGKLKSRAHGRLTAYTPKEDLCQACGLCVVACPEKAITFGYKRTRVRKGYAIDRNIRAQVRILTKGPNRDYS